MIISYRNPPDSGGGTNKTSWATSGALCKPPPVKTVGHGGFLHILLIT
jgi:hypothetical protein